MAITLSSSGGISDPYVGLDGVTEEYTFPNGALEGVVYTDTITVTPTPYASVVSSSVTSSASSTINTAQSSVSGNSTLNITYEAFNSSANTFGGISISASPTLITFTGTMDGIFSDKYMKYIDHNNSNISVTVTSFGDVPSQNAEIYLYKPSFMKYVFTTYNITVVYLDEFLVPVTVEYTVLKRLLNDWTAGKNALKAKVAAQYAGGN